MSEPSDWPLSNNALRIRVPDHIECLLAKHPLSGHLYPTAMGYYPSAALHEMGRVAHDDYILIYCAEGQGHLKTGKYDGAIEQGDMFILPPETPHQYCSSFHAPWTVFWFHFRGQSAKEYFEYLYENTNQLVINTHDVHVLSVFRELTNAAKSSFNLDSFIHVSSLLSNLLITCAQATRNMGKSRGGVDIEKVQEYMRQNVDKKLYLDDLASLSHVSKYHFSRRYLELTGMTPLQHFSVMKIEHASTLLEHTSLSISDIAYQLGYDDALYFSRVFKKQMKLSPRAYRRSIIVHT